MNVIDKAADRLRGRWFQGGWGDDNGNLCALRALGIVGATQEDTLVVYRVLDGKSLTEFNDDPATTEEDVLLLLKKASTRYEEIHGATS